MMAWKIRIYWSWFFHALWLIFQIIKINVSNYKANKVNWQQMNTFKHVVLSVFLGKMHELSVQVKERTGCNSRLSKYELNHAVSCNVYCFNVAHSNWNSFLILDCTPSYQLKWCFRAAANVLSRQVYSIHITTFVIWFSLIASQSKQAITTCPFLCDGSCSLYIPKLRDPDALVII